MIKRMIIIICILCLVPFCLCLSGCSSKHTLKINGDDVEKVTLYPGEISVEYLNNRKDGITLETQDLDKFIQLYNEAAYRGQELDYGTTSQWGCAITLKDGSIIELISECDADFWVGHYKNGTYIGGEYYIQSIELDLLLTDLINKLL